jgi:transketolase N-terminal domain/subunit
MTLNEKTERLPQTIRARALRMVHAVNASHIGACLSIAEIVAAAKEAA